MIPTVVCSDFIKGELECSECTFTTYSRASVIQHFVKKHQIDVTSEMKLIKKASIKEWVKACRRAIEQFAEPYPASASASKVLLRLKCF